MAYVKVKLIAGGKSYDVEVDEDADPQMLAEGFTKKLGLPEKDKYRVHLVGALKIHEGATLRLIKVEPDELFRFL
jgi:hypothetical protein